MRIPRNGRELKGRSGKEGRTNLDDEKSFPKASSFFKPLDNVRIIAFAIKKGIKAVSGA